MEAHGYDHPTYSLIMFPIEQLIHMNTFVCIKTLYKSNLLLKYLKH
jgi:hypothetical protein